MAETEKSGGTGWGRHGTEAAEAIRREVGKAVTGRERETTLLITALVGGGHVLIEDVPGVGKTTLAMALAGATGLAFRRGQFTPDVVASDITGFNLYNKATERFEFREGMVMTNLFLADEINRASPKTQSSLLEAMEERRVSVEGVTYPLPDPFMVIATQNPAGYVGTYPLPEAQLDRFMFRLSMPYAGREAEVRMLMDRRQENPALHIQAAVTPEQIRFLRRAVSHVRMDEALCGYAVDLMQATRADHPYISLGASPRGSVMLMKAAMAYALVQGREYVVPEDVSALFILTTAHRVTLSQRARMEGVEVASVLEELQKQVKVPFRSGGRA